MQESLSKQNISFFAFLILSVLLCFFLFGCDSGDPIPTPSAQPILTVTGSKTVPDEQLIKDALDATDSISRYHFHVSAQFTVTDSKGTRNNNQESEGVVVSPTDVYDRQTAFDGRVGDLLTVNGMHYQKLATESEWQDYATPTRPEWLPTPVPADPNATPTPTSTTFASIRHLVAGGNEDVFSSAYAYQGEESTNGSSFHHLRSSERSSLPDYVNTRDFWIEATTGQIAKYEELHYLPTDGDATSPGTPISSPDYFVRIHTTITIDRYNDLTLALPTPIPTPRITP